MRYARYLRMDKSIAASDAASITDRWRYGRRLLEDGTATTPAGHLRNGVLATLLAGAASAGIDLNEREVSYRLKAGKAYSTEAEFRTARAEYKDWTGLRNAGFPPVEVPEDALPFDPRDADEKRRDAARELTRHSRENSDQLALFDYFPDDKFTELSTLGELAKYAAEMAELTERYARKDRERAAYLAPLIAAVNGDMSATWEQAQAALDGDA